MSDAIIQLSHDAEVKLTAWTIAAGNREFSGLGLIEKDGNTLHVIDVDLLGVGNPSYTEFGFSRQEGLTPDPRRKLWFHRHPLGNGQPGPWNWSGRDNKTAEVEPFGVPAELVAWSCSIVRTPNGWVGRVDFYRPRLRTLHCRVEPSLPSQETIIEASNLIDNNLRRYIDELLQEFERGQRYSVPNEYSADDFDVDDVQAAICPECGVPMQEEVEVVDVGSGELLPTYFCEDCGNTYVVTDHVPPPQPQRKQRPWTQSFWDWANKRE